MITVFVAKAHCSLKILTTHKTHIIDIQVWRNVLQALRGATSVTKFVMSPMSACPKLAHVDLYGSPKLSFVLIQSQTLQSLDLTHCTGVKKVLMLRCSATKGHIAHVVLIICYVA